MPIAFSARRKTLRLAALAVAFGSLVAAGGRAKAATILVTTLDDSDVADADCSLREAIVAANGDAAHQGCGAGNGPDRIEFGVEGTILLGSDLPIVIKDLVLAGPPLAPDQLPALVINGGDHRMFVLDGMPDGRILTVQRLTLREGIHPTGGGCVRFNDGDRLVVADSRMIACRTDEFGGAIFGKNGASMTIRRSSLAGNLGGGSAGALYFIGEGSEDPVTPPTATFVIEDSTFSGNQAEGPGGGVVTGYANGEIRRSTISGNSTLDAGGGLLVIYGYVTVDQSTIAGNTADADNDDTEEAGGGLYLLGDGNVPATVALHSTVIGGNLQDFGQPSDVAAGEAGAILSDGFNLIGVRDGASQFFVVGAPNANDDWVGSRVSPVLAGLAALEDNGGPTKTHAPSPGSLLVDHGDCPGELRDQRGFGDLATLRRPVDEALIPDSSDGCDIGAFEADAVELPAVLFLDGFESGDTGAWSSAVP